MVEENQILGEENLIFVEENLILGEELDFGKGKLKYSSPFRRAVARRS